MMWKLFVLIIVYFIPLISLILFPLDERVRFGRLHSFFGSIEWILAFFRDGILAFILLCYALYTIVLFVLVQVGSGFPFISLIYMAFVGLSVFSFLNRRRRVMKFLNFIAPALVVEPSEFFRLYFASISGLPGRLPEAFSKKLTLPIDYSSGNNNISIWPVIPGLLYTATIARLVIRASKRKDRAFCLSAGDVLTAMWGAMALKVAQARLDVDGLENLKDVYGRSIFVSNHKSFVDFAVVPLIIGLANETRKYPFRARFIAARDHFYDNKFLYSVVGMGKAMEAIGTVFVDRKSQKKSAVAAISDAVSSIVRGGVDIIMYPQGTRAYGNVNIDGHRLDAGYYTTCREDRISSLRSHLKKGVAYMAVDAGAGLAKEGIPLNIIPVGVERTGIIAPRGKIRIQKGVDIRAVFGRPLRLSPADMKDLISSDSKDYVRRRKDMVEDIHVKVDEMLKDVLNINAGLKKRLVLNVRRMMKDDDIERVFEAIDAWRSDQDLIFSIIDCIYSLPAGMWAPFFRRFYQLIVETDTPLEELVEFKRVVVREIVRNR